jgi:hypothetical protein
MSQCLKCSFQDPRKIGPFICDICQDKTERLEKERHREIVNQQQAILEETKRNGQLLLESSISEEDAYRRGFSVNPHEESLTINENFEIISLDQFYLRQELCDSFNRGLHDKLISIDSRFAKDAMHDLVQGIIAKVNTDVVLGVHENIELIRKKSPYWPGGVNSSSTTSATAQINPVTGAAYTRQQLRFRALGDDSFPLDLDNLRQFGWMYENDFDFTIDGVTVKLFFVKVGIIISPDLNGRIKLISMAPNLSGANFREIIGFSRMEQELNSDALVSENLAAFADFMGQAASRRSDHGSKASPGLILVIVLIALGAFYFYFK